jgi:hypothetical protein
MKSAVTRDTCSTTIEHKGIAQFLASILSQPNQSPFNASIY